MTTIANLARLRVTAVHYGLQNTTFEVDPVLMNGLLDIAFAARQVYENAPDIAEALREPLSIFTFEEPE